jgi:hypothetical protein
MGKMFQFVGEHKKMAITIGVIAVAIVVFYQYKKATKIKVPSVVGNPDDDAYKS